jgi:predicted ATP-binding protein involved in virulence
MRIERLTLHDVGPFEDLDISFPECPDPTKAEVHMFIGPNGSGKSTLLYALAQMFGGDLLPARFRSRHGLARLWHDGVFCYASAENERRVFAANDAASFDLTRTREAILNIPSYYYPLSFMAFAYAGGRTLASYELKAIQEPAENPLKNAVSFHHTTDSQALVQWVANTKAKEALARVRGDVDLAQRRARAIEHVEAAIRRMIGQEIRFVLKDDPLAVKILQNGVEISLDVLPDGLKSILAWLADLLMRLDRILWAEKDIDLLKRPFVLFLDEIEIHLHPAWQRKILPAVQELFPNAQIFLSTHSPFVVGSVSDAWVYPLRLVDGRSVCDEPLPSKAGESYATILSEVFGVEQEFDVETEELFQRFHELKRRRLAGDDGVQRELDGLAQQLRTRSVETRDIVEHEMRQLARVLGTAA